MSDTAKRGVPVRFRIMTGGTRPADVVNLAEALSALVEPLLTPEERLRREGQGWVDDYDWGYDEEDTAAVPRDEDGGAAPVSGAAPGEDGGADPGQNLARVGVDTSEDGDSANSTSAAGSSQPQDELPTPPLPATIPADAVNANPSHATSTGTSTGTSTPENTDASAAPKVKEILVPIARGLDPETARRQLTQRISGPLPAKTSLIMQTSGSTTGTGHLVGLSASALVSSARSTIAALGRPGRWILALPVEHIAGFQILTRSILSGTKPVIVDISRGFDPNALVRAVERATSDPEVPAYLSLVPTQVSKILDLGGEPVEALAKLDTILVGGAAFTPFLADRAKATGWHVVETYGMTETCGGCVYDGVPLLGMQVSTVGDQIWICGTTMMEDYLEKPVRVGTTGAEAESHWVQMGPRRWFRTSDTGRMEGPRLIIQGRTDDVINTGGVKVHASAVEESARSVSGVGEVCAVGLPDARWGELVTAVVVPSQDIDMDLLAPMLGSPSSLGVRDGHGGVAEPDSLAARIRTAVTAELGTAHAPRVVVVVQRLPLLTNGKVDRIEVAEVAKRELRAGRAWVR